jgi:hypothetical protein
LTAGDPLASSARPLSPDRNGRPLETPPRPTGRDWLNPDGADPATTPLGAADSWPSELATIVADYDCRMTLATGLGRGESAVAIAAVHDRGGSGAHIAIDPGQEAVSAGEGLNRLRAAGLLHRVQFIDTAPELALPELLRRGAELDFALIQGPKAFEDVFLEFLYLDRMLNTGGIIAVNGAGESEASALLDFVARSRSYEARSPASSALAVVRKLGRSRATEPPFPARWRQPGEHHQPYPERAVRGLRTIAAPLDGRWPEANAPSSLVSTRELYLARARSAELETRAYELGARLVDAELRAARELSELRNQLELAESAHQRAEHWLTCIQSSPSWRLTAPLRVSKKHVRRLFGR